MPSITFQNQIKAPAKSRPNPNSSATHFCAATHQLTKAALSQCLCRGAGCQLCVCLCQALGCSVDVPSTSVCQLLEQLINLFCFYNGSVRQAYQVSPAAPPPQTFTFPAPHAINLCFPALVVSAEQQPGGAGSALGSVPVAPSAGLLGAPSHLHLLEDHRRHQRTSPCLRLRFGWAGSDCVSTSCDVFWQTEKEERLNVFLSPAGRPAAAAQSCPHSPGLPALSSSVGGLYPLQRTVS